ncbi:hypothetical protein VTL71DRAFT_9618 [Oculimacula yallundae]|uniref:Uncharacterized protein n=1 Tax=Oculimacula yallundae TaxID=86028 RepID=A0ABR4BRA9_9HELO
MHYPRAFLTLDIHPPSSSVTLSHTIPLLSSDQPSNKNETQPNHQTKPKNYFNMHGSQCPKCSAASDGGKSCASCGAVFVPKLVRSSYLPHAVMRGSMGDGMGVLYDDMWSAVPLIFRLEMDDGVMGMDGRIGAWKAECGLGCDGWMRYQVRRRGRDGFTTAALLR